jgi:chitodextrinase
MENAVWEIAVPNGDYVVHAVVGDPTYFDVVSKLTIEGLLTINGSTSSGTRWLEGTATVTVNDGKLTVGNLSGSYNKLCYLTISSQATPPPDTAPPIISGVAVSAMTESTATIAWNTNEPADSQVDYGLSSSYGNTTPLDPSMVVSHSRTIQGLLPNTTYHFRVKSRDAAGNLAASQDLSFTTPGQAPPPPSFNVKVNFQPAQSQAYPGYLVDSGDYYGSRGNGHAYGWSGATSPRIRNSSQSPDARYDTLVHMESAAWEIAVPNGTYSVHVVVGDPDWADVVSKLTVEDVLTINGNTSTSNRWLEATVTVSVSDGRLTVKNLAGSYNKICYIEITQQ